MLTPEHVPIKCAVCDKCWRHKRLSRCIYGGPYSGYQKESKTDDNT